MVIPSANEITVSLSLLPQLPLRLGMIYDINLCDILLDPFQKD